jgi:hypothetical protein
MEVNINVNNKFITLPEEYLKSIKIAQRTMEQYNSPIATALANAEHINNIISNNISSQITGAINTYYDKMYRTKDISRVLSDISGILSHKVIEKFNMDFYKLTGMQKTIKRMNELLNSSLASNKIMNSIASLHAAIDVYNPPKILIEQAFKVPIAYQDFAKRQYKYAIKNKLISKRATKVVDEAGNLVLYQQISSETGMEILDEFEPIGKDQNEALLIVPSETNIFSVLNQHISYVYRRDREPNITEAIACSIPAKINGYGCSLVQLIYKINRLSQSLNGKPIFKPTVKSVYGASILPSQVAIDEDTFAKIVDHLYFMIYEGSGDAKRLVKVASDEELATLWHLKRLRLNFRHDVEHGDNIDRKLIKGGNAFNYLINKSWPLAVLDWKKAQLALYKSIINMLQTVINNMKKIKKI